MIDLNLLIPALIFLPAALGFVGCVIPRVAFPVSIAMLISYAYAAARLIGTDFSFVLLW